MLGYQVLGFVSSITFFGKSIDADADILRRRRGRPIGLFSISPPPYPAPIGCGIVINRIYELPPTNYLA